MDSKHEEISSILDRFRHYLTKNEISPLLDAFDEYRTTWSTNKFRMFLTNVLIVMRGWANSPPQQVEGTPIVEDWDLEDVPSNNSTTWDRMRTSAHHLFVKMVDYLRLSVLPGQTDRMPRDLEFDLWKRIISNKWTMNEKFYIHLSEQSVPLPSRLTGVLHNDMFDFYASTARWASATKIRLLELGFVYLLIHDNVFLGCNHILQGHSLFTREDYLAFTEFSLKNPLIYQRKLITSMNTPEKMKIFLDYHPQADLAELVSGNSDLYQQRTPLTIFDRLLKMESFYYETSDRLPLAEVPDFTSDQENVRPANMLYLYQQLLEKGAKISLTLDTAYYQNHRIPFFVSTLGFYLLSLIRYRDSVIVPTLDALDDSDPDILFNALTTPRNVDPTYLDMMNTKYLHYLIKRASTFSPQLRTFFFKHLILACPVLHTQELIKKMEVRENTRLRLLYDEVLEQRGTLTLKQRCRLRIKQAINQYPIDIKKLSALPSSLLSYLSFDLFHPNFVQMTLTKLNQVQGRVKPSFFDELQFHEHNFEQINAHFDWEDQIPDEMDVDDDDHEADGDDDFDNEDADLFDEEGLYSDNHEDDEEEEW